MVYFEIQTNQINQYIGNRYSLKISYYATQYILQDHIKFPKFILCTALLTQITEFVEPLISWLPTLWEAAVDHFMLQTQLLHTARKLTKCLGPGSVKLYPFINPVLKYALTQVIKLNF